jgi:hypothetical protein
LKEFEGHFIPVGKYFGVFEVRGGHLLPTVRKDKYAVELNAKPIADALAEMMRQLDRPK